MRRTAKVVRLMRFLCNVFLVHIFFDLLHAVHHAHIAVDDADTLLGGAGIFFTAFPDLYGADEQPQDFWRQLADFRIPFGFLNERFHVGGRILELLQPRFICGDGSGQFFLLGVVVNGENAELLVSDAPQHIVLIEMFEKCRQLCVPAPHGIQLLLDSVDFPAKLRAVLPVDVLGKQPFLLSREVRHPAQRGHTAAHNAAQAIIAILVTICFFI